MKKTKGTKKISMRILHRYLGFFLAGIMAMYALSGVVMIFRTTDLLKQEQKVEKKLEPNISNVELGKLLRLRDFKPVKTEGDLVYFENGIYNSKTGEASYTVKELPFLLNKMTQIHKATTNSPLYFLNIFFGLSLLFFVISTFWMFRPKTRIFRYGLFYTLGGVVLTLILLFV